MRVTELIRVLQLRLAENGDTDVLLPANTSEWRAVSMCQGRMLLAIEDSVFLSLHAAGERAATGEAVLVLTLEHAIGVPP
jgi:hypothetical protein